MSKTITCREMGGTCDKRFSAETLKEIADKGMAHVKEAADEEHKAILKGMEDHTQEDMDAWNTKMQAVFDGKPDDE